MAYTDAEVMEIFKKGLQEIVEVIEMCVKKNQRQEAMDWFTDMVTTRDAYDVKHTAAGVEKVWSSHQENIANFAKKSADHENETSAARVAIADTEIRRARALLQAKGWL